ncbi:MAG: c-type cytochrome, partial [Bacteroidota bacterium]
NLEWNTGVLVSSVPPKQAAFGHLLAWDPVKQKPAWKVDQVGPWNGGTLTTAGNLVFQGSADGRFVAYNAENGEKLWEVYVGSGVVAAPSTYEVDGKQYVSIAVGWGGVYGLGDSHSKTTSPGKVYTFAIGGEEAMPEFKPAPQKNIVQGVDYNPEDLGLGAKLYISNCVFCHGVPAVNSGGAIPNLGYSEKAKIDNLKTYVLTDALKAKGMPNFTGSLNEAQVEKIKAFIQGTADAVRQQMEAAAAKENEEVSMK